MTAQIVSDFPFLSTIRANYNQRNRVLPWSLYKLLKSGEGAFPKTASKNLQDIDEVEEIPAEESSDNFSAGEKRQAKNILHNFLERLKFERAQRMITNH